MIENAAYALRSLTGRNVSFAESQRLHGELANGQTPEQAAYNVWLFFKIHEICFTYAEHFENGVAAQNAYDQMYERLTR